MPAAPSSTTAVAGTATRENRRSEIRANGEARRFGSARRSRAPGRAVLGPQPAGRPAAR